MKNVLIVEDIPENRYLLRSLLEGHGYRVSEARNGVEALQAARQEQPDLVVSDVLMPQMDGFELCRTWMKDGALKQTPFVFYSATYVHREDKELALALGARRYLIKPLESDELLGELEAVLREHASESAVKAAAPLDEPAFHSLHDAALARKLEQKISQLEAARGQLQATLDAIPDLLFEMDLQGRYIEVHAPRSELLVVPKVDLVGKLISEVMPEDAVAVIHEALREANDTGLSQGKQFELALPQGTLWFELSVSRKEAQPSADAHFIVISRDVTSRKSAQDRAQQLAFFDPLTGLPNRRLLVDRLQQALNASARRDCLGGLLLVDLDNFKDINDTSGHVDGDRLLTLVAKRLSACAREGDTVARLGSDEFVILMEDLGRNPMEAATQAKSMGEKVLAELSCHYPLAGGAHRCTASVGVTLFGEEGQESTDGPMKRADLAVHQAKQAGRNTLRFFDPQMQAVVSARAVMEAGLREALEQGNFVLHYQPQVTQAHQIVGVEALVRWQPPGQGMISPDAFIPLAEETGLILPLGAWVIETACKQLARWGERPETASLTMAVNVSARQFRQDDFVEQVLSTVARTGANPRRLKLELTETLLVTNVEEVIVKMKALKNKGVGFSLDDFGTGYSSLTYLKRLPLDQLKIDRAFVQDMLIDANDAAIARMIIALADTMGLAVLAEGVESEAQRSFLAELGCHDCQGYLFSKPLPIEAFDVLALRW